MGCKLLLFPNEKWHTGFLLVPKWLKINDFKRRNDRYFAIYHGNRQLLADYAKVLEDRPIDPEAKARASGSEREMGQARARENFSRSEREK